MEMTNALHRDDLIRCGSHSKTTCVLLIRPIRVTRESSTDALNLSQSYEGFFQNDGTAFNIMLYPPTFTWPLLFKISARSQVETLYNSP